MQAQAPGPDQRVARVAALFDRVADTYDAVGVPWFGPIADDLVAALDVRPGERAVDVGCGRGAVLHRVADAVGPSGRVTGVDLAPGMVRRAAEELASRPQVDVVLGDARAPDLPAGRYDVVAASLVLFFLPDPAAAVRAWTALLAPGGRLGVTTFAAQDDAWRALDDVFTPWLPPALLDARTSGRTGPFGSDEGVAGLLRGAGLEQVRTSVRRHTVSFRDVDAWQTWSWSHGQRAMWESVPRERWDEVRGQAAELLRRHAGQDDAATVGQQVRTTVGRLAG